MARGSVHTLDLAACARRAGGKPGEDMRCTTICTPHSTGVKCVLWFKPRHSVHARSVRVRTHLTRARVATHDTTWWERGWQAALGENKSTGREKPASGCRPSFAWKTLS